MPSNLAAIDHILHCGVRALGIAMVGLVATFPFVASGADLRLGSAAPVAAEPVQPSNRATFAAR